MPETVTAGERDTFCSIAVEHGFADCDPLRRHATNAAIAGRELRAGDDVFVPDPVEGRDTAPTEQTTRFVRRGLPLADIRFVHGSATRPYRQDATLRFLNISNFKTDQAGAPETAVWVDHNHRAYDADAHADVDSFKVEVLDVRTGQTDLPVQLDALRPVYDAAGAVTRHDDFPGNRATAGTEANRRSLDATASQQGSTRRFRTCYLRLVVDEIDHGPAPGRALQTLLVTDDVRAGGDQQIEILDQQVRATYTLAGCPAPVAARCRVTRIVPVGEDQRRERIAVHVLRAAPGGAPVVRLAQVRWRINKWFRRLYAQANVAPVMVQVRDVDPPDDMLVVSEREGNLARGDERMQFRVRATRADTTSDTADIDYRPRRRHSPVTTANALARLITNGLAAHFNRADITVTVARNCQLVPNIGRPTDVLIHVNNCRVTVENVVSTGARQFVSACRVNPAAVPPANDTDFNTGSSEERCLWRNFNTGNDRLNIAVISSHTTGLTGEALGPFAIAPAAKRPDAVIWPACVVIAATIDNTDTFPYLVAHEAGHAVFDLNHTSDTTQLIWGRPGAEPGANTLDGPKRIADRRIRHDGWAPGSHMDVNLVNRIRRNGRWCLRAW